MATVPTADLNVVDRSAALANPAGLDTCAIVAPCTAGPTDTWTYVASTSALRTLHTSGPGVELGAYLLDGPNPPQLLVYNPSAPAAATLGSIDVTGIAGTATATVAGTPTDSAEFLITVERGGIVGVDDITNPCITYTTSWDDGYTTEPGPTRLGTATTITPTGSGVTFTLAPGATNAAYVTLAVELRADTLAHLANAVAHDGADTSAAQIALNASGVPATVSASTAVVNLVLTALVSHVVNITSVHDGPDLVAYAALAALSAATDAKTGIDLANALKAILNTHDAVALTASTAGLLGATTSIVAPTTYTAAAHFLAGGVAALDAQPRRLKFTISGGGTPADMDDSVTITGFDYAGNAQTETALSLTGLGTIISTKAWKGTGLSCALVGADGTGASFQIGYSNGGHNSADATNTISAADATYGTLLAGDVIRVEATEAQPAGADYTAALLALGNQSRAFRAVGLTGVVTTTEFDTIDTAAAALATGFDYCRVLFGVRDYTSGERTEAEVGNGDPTYQNAIANAWAAKAATSKRLGVSAGYRRIVSPITGRQIRRPFWWAALARYMDNDVAIDTAQVDLGALRGVIATNPAGLDVEHDEEMTPGLGGFSDGGRFITARKFKRKQGVYVCIPWLMSSTGSDFSRLHLGGVMDVACNVIHSVLTDKLAQGVVLNSDGTIAETDANRLENAVNSALYAALIQSGGGHPTRASNAEWICDRTTDLRTPGTPLTGIASVTALGYLEEIDTTIGFTSARTVA